MNYAEFKAHLVTFLWKDGDQVLIDNIDSLIEMADDDLNTLLKIPDLEGMVDITVLDVTVDVPTDFYKVRTMALTQLGELFYVEPGKIPYLRENAAEMQPVYSLTGGGANTKILLTGPINSSTPPTLTLIYQKRLPDFKGTDASWFADDHKALYTYSILSHASAFLREDERIAQWSQMAGTRLENLNSDAAFNRARGMGANVPLPRPASAVSYRNWRRGL